MKPACPGYRSVALNELDHARPAQRPIGYYVHHHGQGHASRFAKIAEASTQTLVPISELDLGRGIRLPADVVRSGSDPTAGGALHWAPVGDPGSSRRSDVFGRWLTQAQPAGVVIDVSVEAALLCRLFGVATVVVRQHGDRTDAAHESGYRSARTLLAPFPRELEHEATPVWIRRKTRYAGFIGRWSEPRCRPPDCSPGTDDVLVLWGTGGGALTLHDLESIVAAAAPVCVYFAGSHEFDIAAVGVIDLGWVNDVGDMLCGGPTVIGSAGNNVVADAASAGCALVVAPQQRPFQEQSRHAESLDAAGAAAVVGMDGARDWPAALDIARRRRPVLGMLTSTSDGAAAAAAIIAGAFGDSPSA